MLHYLLSSCHWSEGIMGSARNASPIRGHSKWFMPHWISQCCGPSRCHKTPVRPMANPNWHPSRQHLPEPVILKDTLVFSFLTCSPVSHPTNTRLMERDWSTSAKGHEEAFFQIKSMLMMYILNYSIIKYKSRLQDPFDLPVA